MRYSSELKRKVINLRKSGRTYQEIKAEIKLEVPKGTISYWCRAVNLPDGYKEKIMNLNNKNLLNARQIAIRTNKAKREKLLEEIKARNSSIAEKITTITTAKIALAMLCMGEASKSMRGTSFYFGNSDPKVVNLFLRLLKKCFDFDINKVRCTVQCRADQNTPALEKFWQNNTHIPKRLFYATRIDPRTKGKPTKNKNYKGVLRVDYFDYKIRLDLESLADLVYNRLH